MQHHDVLIVGAGQAGAQAAISLRQLGFQGSIGIVGAEPAAPYERPPLSKAYLAGEIDSAKLSIRPPAFWDQQQVSLRTGVRISRVDAAAHLATTQTGETIGYSHLIWAAGGEPRRLSCAGADLPGVHVVRTTADVDEIRAELGGITRVVVIGGGYIGLESAAILVKAGKQVTVLEAMDRVLARVTAPEVSRFYEAQHRAHGVDVRLGTAVECLVGEGGRVSAVRLADGQELPADMVIVGIGLVPEVQALKEAGAACSNGIEVDGRCRTSLPDVYAVGDCALHENRYAGGARVRLESVQNAVDQSKVVAANLAGVPTDYNAVPWFWSNQYDLRLQTVGLSLGYDDAVLRGDPASRSFSVVYLGQGRVLALDCINAAKDFVAGKKLVSQQSHLSREQLADVSVDLRTVS